MTTDASTGRAMVTLLSSWASTRSGKANAMAVAAIVATRRQKGARPRDRVNAGLRAMFLRTGALRRRRNYTSCAGATRRANAEPKTHACVLGLRSHPRTVRRPDQTVRHRSRAVEHGQCRRDHGAHGA